MVLETVHISHISDISYAVTVVSVRRRKRPDTRTARSMEMLGGTVNGGKRTRSPVQVLERTRFPWDRLGACFEAIVNLPVRRGTESVTCAI